MQAQCPPGANARRPRATARTPPGRVRTHRQLACHAKPAKAPPLLVARRKRVATRSSERWVKEEELSVYKGGARTNMEERSPRRSPCRVAEDKYETENDR